MTVSRLAEFRTLKGMTQKSLADALGVARTSISAVENGHVEAWPKFRRDAASALAVEEDALFPAQPTTRVKVALLWTSEADVVLLSRLASVLLVGHLDEEQAP